MRDIQADVREFMTAFKQEMHNTPQWPDQATTDLRVQLKAEEFCEWLRDSGYDYTLFVTRQVFDSAGYYTGDKMIVDAAFEHDIPSEETQTPGSLPKSADALIDDLYVTVGALLAMGIDMWPLWDAVHAANMAKVGGPVVNGKQMKPEGWQPPDIEALLREQGWSE